MKTDIALRMPEKQLQASTEQLAKLLGWRYYHTYRSTRSVPGFPDLVLVHPGQGRLIFAELKSTRGRTSKAQQEWLEDLSAAGQEVHVWYPKDWVNGTIRTTLQSP